MIPQNELIQAVTRTFLFDGIDERSATALLSSIRMEHLSFRSSELICSPERFRRGLYLIISGAATVTSPYGDGDAILRMLAPGDIFGAAALFEKKSEEYVSCIRAKGHTEVIWLPGDEVERLITRSGDIAKNYIVFLSGRIRFLNRRISILTAGSSEQRLACLLSELPQDESGRPLLPKMNKLASTLNLGRATLYRAISTLESLMIIRRDDDGGITIINPEALKKIFLQDPQ